MYEYQEITNRLLALWPGLLVGGVVIGAAHIGFWRAKLTRTTAYIVGSTCVLIGEGVSTLIDGDIFPILFHFLHLSACGLVIMFAWWIRGEQEARAVADEDAKAIKEAAERERTA